MSATAARREHPAQTARSHRAPVAPLLSVVVPTFNERENITSLTQRLGDALTGIDFELIFVDDSTDDTPQVILHLNTEYPVKLIHREVHDRAGGLTTAIVRGLRSAKGEYVSVLDGDLQHPPEKLAELLRAALREGADVVVASRYLRGGSADGLPGVMRRAISLSSKWISKILFYERLRPTTDPGSGFFLLRREVIEGVELRPVGYKMLTEILVRGRWLRLSEVPYRFGTRHGGASKAGLRQGMEYLQHTARILVEVPEVARLWKFLGVGASGVIVNLGLLWAATALLSAPRYGGWLIGVEASILTNFWLNRTLTWRDRRAVGAPATAAEGGRYHVSSLLGVTANFVAFTAATAIGAPTLAAGCIGIIGGFAANFTGASRFVFRSPAQEPTTPPLDLTPQLLPVPVRADAFDANNMSEERAA